MSWTREDFLAVLNTDIAKNLLADKDVADYVQKWSLDNQAALLHANDVSEKSKFEEKLPLLRLVAAFGQKNIEKMISLIMFDKVSVGARLDYFLPLYDKAFHAGEDIFVAAVKMLLCGKNANPHEGDIKLKDGQMFHKVGDDKGKPYNAVELEGTAAYVNSSFTIRRLLEMAPNRTIIQPNRLALDYILSKAATYRDSNQNPVIVFIPGAISIEGRSTSSLIRSALQYGANVNDVGFFGVPGIVWSAILADVEAVNTFLDYNAAVDIEDEMGNHHVAAWAAAAHKAATSSDSFKNRALETIVALGDSAGCQPNFSGATPNDYLAGSLELVEWLKQKSLAKEQKTPILGLSRQASYFQPAVSASADTDKTSVPSVSPMHLL